MPEGGLGGVGASLLIVHEWPMAVQDHHDAQAEQEFASLQQLIVAIRNIRSQHGLTPKQEVNIRIQSETELMKALVKENSEIIKSLARVSEIFEEIEPREPILLTDSAVLGDTTVHVVVPVDRETQTKKLAVAQKEKQAYIEMTKKKLEDFEFTSKAPVHVVQRMKSNLEQAEQELAGILTQLEAFN